MNHYLKIGLSLLVGLWLSTTAIAAEWTAEVGLESTLYLHKAGQGQSEVHPSVRFEGEYYRDWNDGLDSFTFSPLVVFDIHDSERRHWDIAELAGIHVDDGWEIRVGIRTVFWGITETTHLVDVINQTDLVMNIDGEDKLGQPMINLSIDQSWGTLDLYVMSFFRERTFPGEEGRVRGPWVVDVDNAQYESSNKKRRLEGAIRWHQYYGDFDIALSHFTGTGREPYFAIQGTGSGVTFVPNGLLTPIYPIIDQTGIEMQYIYEGWALKLEGITHYGYKGRYSATVFGFEYTHSGIYDSRIDLGWVVEYSYDERGIDAPIGIPEHDLTIATRWTWNDVDATEVLIGIVADERSEEIVFFLEGSRRIGEYWKVNVESRVFSGGYALPEDIPTVFAHIPNIDPNNKHAYLQDDDFLKIELIRYF